MYLNTQVWVLFYLLTSARADFFLCPLNDSALLCTTAEGWLQRVVVLGTETHVIEEIQLFETAQPVDSLTISHSKVRRKSGGCMLCMKLFRGSRCHLGELESPDLKAGAVISEHVTVGLHSGAVISLLTMS